MTNVNLTIGGRTFAVSASDGQETQIEMLGRMIDERVRKLGLAGQTETRMLLFAALVLADELHEAHAGGTPPAPPPPPAPAAPEVVSPEPAEIPPELLERVANLAERVEKLAATLEQSGPTP